LWIRFVVFFDANGLAITLTYLICVVDWVQQKKGRSNCQTSSTKLLPFAMDYATHLLLVPTVVPLASFVVAHGCCGLRRRYFWLVGALRVDFTQKT